METVEFLGVRPYVSLDRLRLSCLALLFSVGIIFARSANGVDFLLRCYFDPNNR